MQTNDEWHTNIVIYLMLTLYLHFDVSWHRSLILHKFKYNSSKLSYQWTPLKC